ncbi:glutathione S-transferase [Caulobacter sp. Root655]|uniref:glutathione S-transferase N-terminal domain-containing protein n=1 Tax=Caulobacter sp. Root655 TaxID=1736578 RepID=UPI0006F55450|nr:glutathione S-transferase N-terminal domain-containing protein [Caulobacter sp. Root655]KRA66009.1 glutathione S-transferase [Caulobacter sp. Root655]
MQLLYSAMSPFARKVRVVAFELGLAERLELVPATPYTDESLRAINPLSKIPVLIPDEGSPIFDSPVICEYLEHLAGVSLTPASGPERWAALTQQALADGMGDAALAIVRERLRDGEGKGPGRQDLFDRQAAALNAALDKLEAEGLPADRFQIGEIAVAAQLAYLDGRVVLAWREGRPNLAAWYETASRRTSMVATAPQLA